MKESEGKVVDEFKNFLLSHYPNRIELIELFGSKARGDSDEDSDVDLLVVVDKEDREVVKEHLIFHSPHSPHSPYSP